MTAKAIQISGFSSASSFDGKWGLLTFTRMIPVPGQDEFTVAVPVDFLPILAGEALRMLPQPEPGLDAELPAVFPASNVELGLAPHGQITLVMTIDQGACIAFEIDLAQATLLRQALSSLLGNPTAGPIPERLN